MGVPAVVAVPFQNHLLAAHGDDPVEASGRQPQGSGPVEADEQAPAVVHVDGAVRRRDDGEGGGGRRRRSLLLVAVRGVGLLRGRGRGEDDGDQQRQGACQGGLENHETIPPPSSTRRGGGPSRGRPRRRRFAPRSRALPGTPRLPGSGTLLEPGRPRWQNPRLMRSSALLAALALALVALAPACARDQPPPAPPRPPRPPARRRPRACPIAIPRWRTSWSRPAACSSTCARPRSTQRATSPAR